ncbi:unnamed protein product [Colias eurytheme]|nr:unnamed protein product [Colias eurytheme]
MSSNSSALINEDIFNTDSDDHSSDSSYHNISPIPLNETLISQFSNVVKNFNVIHINAQSLPAHYSDFLTSFDCSCIHAIVISETWLKPCLPSTAYSLPGFNIIRNDRVGRVGGGVAIYLKSSITYSVISASPQPTPVDSLEHLFLEITLCHQKVLLGALYSPNLSVDYFSYFDQLLDKFTRSFQHVILMGDLNTCLIKNDHRSKKLLSTIDCYNMNILPLNATHHFPDCSPSLLDLIIVSSLDYVAIFGQCAAEGFSYHDLIFVSYKIRPPKYKPKVIIQRNFSGMDIESLVEEAKNLNWSLITNADDIDAKINLFNSFLLRLYDKHTPFRPIKLKHLPAPWLTPELKSLINKKNRAKALLTLTNPMF